MDIHTSCLNKISKITRSGKMHRQQHTILSVDQYTPPTNISKTVIGMQPYLVLKAHT